MFAMLVQSSASCWHMSTTRQVDEVNAAQVSYNSSKRADLLYTGALTFVLFKAQMQSWLFSYLASPICCQDRHEAVLS